MQASLARYTMAEKFGCGKCGTTVVDAGSTPDTTTPDVDAGSIAIDAESDAQEEPETEPEIDDVFISDTQTDTDDVLVADSQTDSDDVFVMPDTQVSDNEQNDNAPARKTDVEENKPDVQKLDFNLASSDSATRTPVPVFVNTAPKSSGCNSARNSHATPWLLFSVSLLLILYRRLRFA